MAYCQPGFDSDFYVWTDGDFIWCSGCSLSNDGDFAAADADGMLDHLQLHIKAGHQVPERAIVRLLREVAGIKSPTKEGDDE